MNKTEGSSAAYPQELGRFGCRVAPTDILLQSYRPQVAHGGSHMCGNHVAGEQLLGVSKLGTLC